MWLRRAALAHTRVRTASLSRSLPHLTCVVNSMTRFATSVRSVSSTSPRPQLDSKSGTGVIDLDAARRVLRDTFGHKTFRSGQEEVIPRILSGDSMTISWPSQSGASICYLVPAVLESSTVNRGITIVVSISRAFLRHKVETLCGLGIHVDVVSPLNAEKSPSFEKTRNAALDRVRTGRTRILYLFSQYSADRDVLHAINSAPGGVQRVVIEDATHFTTLESQAVRFLKYDMDKIKRLIRGTRPKSVVVIANSCHPDVAEDVRRNFDLPDCSTHSIPILPPPNLELHAYAGPVGHTSLKYVAELIRRRPGPTVLFAQGGKMTYDVVTLLKKAGLSARTTFTTKALTSDESQQAFSRFAASKVDILCTSGPGARLVDHPHIRNVVINSLPASVSTIFRQLSVAGRDGGWSKVFVVLEPGGIQQSETVKRSLMPCRRDIRVLLNKIFLKAGANSTVYVDTKSLRHDLDLATEEIEYMVGMLRDHLGIIAQEDTEFLACEYRYSRRGFDLNNSAKPIDKSIAANSVKSGVSYHLQLRDLGARIEGFDSLEVVARLQQLSGHRCLKLYLYDRRLKVRILKHPVPYDGSNSLRAIEEWVHAYLHRGLQTWKQSRQEIIELFTKDRCTSVGLAEHFGTQLPGGRARCERCDWCLTGKPLVLAPVEEEDIDSGKVKAVLEAVPDRDNPRFLARLAAGVASPRVEERDLAYSPIFRSMRHVNFDALVRVFAKECGVPDEEVDDWL